MHRIRPLQHPIGGLDAERSGAVQFDLAVLDPDVGPTRVSSTSFFAGTVIFRLHEVTLMS